MYGKSLADKHQNSKECMCMYQESCLIPWKTKKWNPHLRCIFWLYPDKKAIVMTWHPDPHAFEQMATSFSYYMFTKIWQLLWVIKFIYSYFQIRPFSCGHSVMEMLICSGQFGFLFSQLIHLANCTSKYKLVNRFIWLSIPFGCLYLKDCVKWSDAKEFLSLSWPQC